MLKAKTECSKCIHQEVCAYKNNTEMLRDKLANMIYGDGPNDDYDWDTMSDHHGVDIEFSCRHFNRKECDPRSYASYWDVR